MLVIPQDGDLSLFTGELELRNAKERVPWVHTVGLYHDFPGLKPPFLSFAEKLVEWNLNKGKIGFDQKEYRAGSLVTSSGEPIQAKYLEPGELVWAGDIVAPMRYIKDDEEISILKECTRWGNLGMSILKDLIEPGLSEAEISLKAEYEASKALLRAMPSDWEPYSYGSGPVYVFFKAGPRAILSHRNPSSRKVQKGDIIYANSSGNIYGYSDELERNFFVGEPDEKTRKLHTLALRAQDVTIEALNPGARCADPQKAAMKLIREAGYSHCVFAHVGHGRGLSRHEPPFLDEGDSTRIEPRMEFSAEPKLLMEGLGHIGHSDTILITPTGHEVVTYYPREIESLIV